MFAYMYTLLLVLLLGYKTKTKTRGQHHCILCRPNFSQGVGGCVRCVRHCRAADDRFSIRLIEDVAQSPR